MTSYPAIPEYSSVRTVRVMKGVETVEDVVIAEEPLEIIIVTPDGETALATTMRTPGHDVYLCLGYLISEGAKVLPESITRSNSCADDNNQICLYYSESPFPTERTHSRLGVQSSSCGLCGKTSLADLLKVTYPGRTIPTRQWQAEDLLALSKGLAAQPLFQKTGGSHAVWLFNENNEIVAAFEDVGRHNALDKMLGWATQNSPENINNMTLVLSSRLSYELIHKAALLGTWVVIALGAPSSLAVELANKLEITSLGFFKGETYNLYSNRKAYFRPSRDNSPLRKIV